MTVITGIGIPENVKLITICNSSIFALAFYFGCFAAGCWRNHQIKTKIFSILVYIS